MARPKRLTVDYFPFMCKEGKPMFFIEKKYGNDGFATWIKILRQMAVTDYHYLNLSSDLDLMFLSSKCNITEELLTDIVKDLVKIGEFDAKLWEQNKVIYSPKFMENISPVYEKRANSILTYDELTVRLSGKNTRKQSKSIPKQGFTELKGAESTQSIVEYSKVDDSIVDKTIVDKRTLTVDDRKNTFSLHAKSFNNIYEDNLIEEFIDYWTEANPQGKKMKFEMQKTFQINLRLKKWYSNSLKFTNNGKTFNNKKPTVYEGHKASYESIKRYHENHNPFAEYDD